MATVTITDAQYSGSYESAKARSRVVISFTQTNITNTVCYVTQTIELQVKSSVAGTVITRNSGTVSVIISSYKDGAVDGSSNYTFGTGTTTCTSANTWYTAKKITVTSTFTRLYSESKYFVSYADTAAFGNDSGASASYVFLPTVGSPTSSTTLYTVPKRAYTVSYDANGGTGAPAAQTKLYGETLKLSTTNPTKTGCDFSCWNTNSSGTGTNYSPGQDYTGNANVTLYAKWLASLGVNIGTVNAIRVDTSSSTTESDEGEYAYITVPYTVDGASAASVSMAVTATADSGTDPTVTLVSYTATKALDTVATGTFTARASGCSAEGRYTFTVTVTAQNTTISGQADVVKTKSVVLPMAFYTLDVLAGGHGMGIGKPATREALDVGMDSHFDGIVTIGDLTDKYVEINGLNASNLPNGSVRMVGATVDLTEADNGLSESQYRGVNANDASGNLFGYIQYTANTNGSTYTILGARNYGTGSAVSNQLRLDVANDGTRSVSFSDRALWLSALDIGTRKYNYISTAVSVATSTYKSIGSLSLEVGKWVISFGAQFAANSTGFRQGFLYTEADVVGASDWLRASANRANAVSAASSVTYLQGSHIVTNSSARTIYLTLYQNSGSSLSCYGYLCAVKVG